MSSFPVLVHYAEVVDFPRTVRAPMLNATAALLVARGADEIILPYPTLGTAADHDLAIRSVPRERRHIIRVVDETGDVLERITDYLDPLTKHKAELSSDLNELRQFLYDVALATRYRAGIVEDSVHRARRALLKLPSSSFSGEAKYRLAELIRLVASYSPARAAHASFAGDVSEIGANLRLWEIIDSAAYRELSIQYGRLGFLREPGVALRVLVRYLRDYLKRDDIRSTLQFAQSVSDVAPAAASTGRFLGSVLALGTLEPAYSPPFLPLHTETQQIIDRVAVGECLLTGKRDLFRQNFIGSTAWSSMSSEAIMRDPHNWQPKRVTLSQRQKMASRVQQLQLSFG